MKKKLRWYHCSPKRLPVGTLLIGGHKPNFNLSCEHFVYITTDEIPHFTIVHDVECKRKDTWHVYEVKPHGKIEVGMWDDGLVESATIIRYVGNAKGILNRLHRNTNPRKPKEGSMVRLKPMSKMIEWADQFYKICVKRNTNKKVFGY